ncbi:hypothetical protein Tco_0864944, partial [Tanacetum coccineum]
PFNPYTPQDEPIPTNKRAKAAEIFSDLEVERNKRIFTSDKKKSNELVAEIFNHLRLKLASLLKLLKCVSFGLGRTLTLLCALSLLVVSVHKEGFLNEKGFMNFGVAMFAGRKRRAINMGILVPSSTLLGG